MLVQTQPNPPQPNQAQPNQVVQQAVLQSLYAVFLGGIITAFLVVGLTTFYPQPQVDDVAIAELDRQVAGIYDACGAAGSCADLSSAQRAELQRLEGEREILVQEQQEAQRVWSRNAGLLLIGCATALLALSLLRSERAIVLSNGLLLGGLFTMVGGVGLSVAGGTGPARLLVLTLVVGITVALGYLRFARRAPAAAQPIEPVSAGGDPALEQRVAALEGRLAEVRRVLGG